MCRSILLGVGNQTLGTLKLFRLPATTRSRDLAALRDLPLPSIKADKPFSIHGVSDRAVSGLDKLCKAKLLHNNRVIYNKIVR